MKKTVIGLSLLARGIAGTAYAAGQGPNMDPFDGKTVTKAEFQAKGAEMFAKMDANKDGKLDAADKSAHMGQMFDQFDTDKNGSLSRDEFMAAHQRGPEGAGEHGRMMGDHGGRGDKMGMMMMHMADANKDGTVTKDEFLAAHAQHFDKMDTNKDGKLTKEERKAGHKMMRGMMGGKRGEHRGHDMGDMPPPPPPPAG